MKLKAEEGVYPPNKQRQVLNCHFMIFFGCALVYIELMYYACFSVCIYTIELNMMGKKSMIMHNIKLPLIYIETSFLAY